MRPANRIANFGKKDVWGIFTPLAQKHNAVNLGQGFPNVPAAEFVKKSTSDAIYEDWNQYSPSRGLAHLTNAVANLYESTLNRKIDPISEVMVAQGANQAILSILQAFVNEGDEVVLIEPFFDIYSPQIIMNGGVLKSIEMDILKDKKTNRLEFKLDFSKLKQAINANTKFLILNTPHNPTGKVFTREELFELSKIINQYPNLYVISDEVYDKLILGNNCKHVPFATLPGMWEKTFTIGSSGKMFGVTGWRVGWIIGPSHLLKWTTAVTSRTVFCTPTPLQEGIARSIDISAKTEYFITQNKDLEKRRDFLVELFDEIGIPITFTEGSYFFIADMSVLNLSFLNERKGETEEENEEAFDFKICRWLVEEIGVAAIPCSAFYYQVKSNSHYVRFCFYKTNETLEAAKQRLLKLKNYLPK